MTAADLDRVMEIAESVKGAPRWPREVYLAVLNPEGVPWRVALVATGSESGSQVVIGFAVVSLIAPEAELETIAVASEWQRRGVARRLFAELTAELRGAGVVDFHLEVRDSNHPAVGLYTALGFEETGRRPRYYVEPVEDALLLRRHLVDFGPEFHSLQ
jgi:ribosomal-protein-alanine N-acetyltransferase